MPSRSGGIPRALRAPEYAGTSSAWRAPPRGPRRSRLGARYLIGRPCAAQVAQVEVDTRKRAQAEQRDRQERGDVIGDRAAQRQARNGGTDLQRPRRRVLEL